MFSPFIFGDALTMSSLLKVLCLIIIVCSTVACQTTPIEIPNTSPIPTPNTDSTTISSPIPTPVSEITSSSPTPYPSPTVENLATSTGAIRGQLTNPITGEPVIGVQIRIGEIKNGLIEISQKHAPATITDEGGYFVFTDVPINDASFKYVLGILLLDRGAIIVDPETGKQLVFDVKNQQILDVGKLKSVPL